MSNISRLRKLLPDDDFSSLEASLQRVLIPVFPSQHFVQELQARLLREAASPEGLRTLRLVQFMLVSTAVLAGISILMITGIRVLIGILTLIGLIENISRKQNP